MTNMAFRSPRGLVGGLALLVATGLVMAGLSGCGAPAYTYVADSANSTYYKVPTGWHAISQSSIDQVLTSGGGSTNGIWITAFDAGKSPSASNFLSFGAASPFVFSEVLTLSQDASNGLSYDGLRDFMLPVSSNGREEYEASGDTSLTGFTSLRDDTITAANGVHGVRETYQYTYNGVSDTFDQVALTNADQTVVYFLIVHCTNSCYTQNVANINTIVSSFTVESPT